jgi:hypothetical protein
LLLKLVIDAGKKLDKLCPVTTWKDDDSGEQRFLDEDGRTRRLLLRIASTIRAIQATQEYVGRGPMKTRGSELDNEFGERRAVFDKALKEFRTKLNIPAED